MKTLLYEIEELLKKGLFVEVQKKCEKLTASKLSRVDLLNLANLARRVGFPELTIQLLNPIVRPKNLKETSPTPLEKAVYAGGLVKIWALEEAMDILDTIASKSAPEALLFKGHALLAGWDYAAAIAPFKEYLTLPQLTKHERFLGNLNLASCYVVERQLIEADKLLAELRTTSEKGELVGFYGNVLELSAQWAIHSGDWKEAHHFLDQAEKAFADSTSPYAYFVRKWRAFLKLSESKIPEKHLPELQKIREEAVTLKLWESIRDCDFWKAVKTGDEQSLIHLYFGTPFPSFRKRIFLEYGKQIEIPKNYYWNTKANNKKDKIHINFSDVKTQKEIELISGGLSENLISIFTSDFYRPLRVGVLHAKLFPKQYFNPDSSPMRVYQAVKTLRDSLEKGKLPIIIQNSNDGYFIEMQEGVSISVLKPQEGVLIMASKVDSLKEKLSGKYFSVKDVEEVLSVSRSTAKRVVNEALENHDIERIGHGSTTQYCFIKKKLVA